MKKVLTIAGSDSGGGAGIQADLKTFAANGVYGMSAITALTAQNTVGVQGVFSIPVAFVGQQIDSVMEDIGADAWKLGMLANEEIIKIVADKAKKYQIKFLILDPVMVAKSGDFLLEKKAMKALINNLIPLSYAITPNLHEASALTSMKITTLDDMKLAAKKIYTMGAKYVVIKGGHLSEQSDAIDIVYDGKTYKEFSAPRVETKHTHGTGCTFASAIAAELAKGFEIYQATEKAKVYITNAIEAGKSLHIGDGCGPLNHFYNA